MYGELDCSTEPDHLGLSNILLHRSVRSHEVALDPDPHHGVVVRDYGLSVDQHVVEQGVGDHWLVSI